VAARRVEGQFNPAKKKIQEKKFGEKGREGGKRRNKERGVFVVGWLA
jgi:hypothetical protein